MLSPTMRSPSSRTLADWRSSPPRLVSKRYSRITCSEPRRQFTRRRCNATLSSSSCRPCRSHSRRTCAVARSRNRSTWYHDPASAMKTSSGNQTSSTAQSSRVRGGRGSKHHARIGMGKTERGCGIGGCYFTRSTRRLWLQPCTYISQLPRIMGLIVTSGLSTSGHEYVPDSACFQTWPLSRVNVVWPAQPIVEGLQFLWRELVEARGLEVGRRHALLQGGKLLRHDGQGSDQQGQGG